MSQQINLFSPSLRPQRPFLTASRLALALGGLILVMAGYGAYLTHRLKQAEVELAQTNTRLKDIQDETVKLGQGAARAKGQALEESIAKSEAELKLRQGLLDRLKGGGLASSKGFSDYMVALARQRLDGVWVTGLKVAASGEFTIQGGVTRPEILPEYIRRLSREEVLKGRQIGDLRMQRKEVEVRDERATPGAAGGEAAGQSGAKQRWRFVEFSMGNEARNQPGG